MNIKDLRKYKGSPIYQIGEGTLKISGETVIKFQFQGVEIEETVLFSPEVEGIALSWYKSKEIGILPQDYPNTKRVTMRSLQQEER